MATKNNMQVVITAIKRTPRVSKTTGKEFTSVGIMTDQHGSKWLSGFANTENADWDIGQTVEIEVETKGDYLNFKIPKRDMSPAAKDPASAELKNILQLQLIPQIDQTKAAIAEVKFLIQALGDRLEKVLSAEEPPFEEPTF